MTFRLPRHLRLAALGLLLCGGIAACITSVSSAARPLIKITQQPAKRTTSKEALFRFKSPASRISCRLDRRAYRRCRGGVKYSGLTKGDHRFTVKASYRGRTALVTRRWTVISKAKRQPAPLPLGAVHATTNPETGLPAIGAQLVFADEFNGTTLDTAAWNVYDGPGHTGNGLRRPEAFALDGAGNLVVTAQNVDGKIVSGGMANRLEFTYGRIEFRVKAEPDPTGQMSAGILTWPKQQWSPEFTEIDMYETGPHVSNDRRFDTYVHFAVQNYQKWTTHLVDPSQWHVIAADWKSDLLEIYVDGRLSFSISDPAVIPDILHHVTIQLDALGTRPLTRPVRLWVDYVRIYQ